MPTAFVLSGGGSLGAIQVGMLRALLERGVEPDLVVGSSVGAVNGAWLAARPRLEDVDRLAEIWLSLSRGDVFPVRPLAGLLGFLGRSDHLVPSGNFERLLQRNTPARDFAGLEVPLHLVATDVETGAKVVLDEGPLIPAVLASAAIPGVFPPVHLGGRTLMDGGVVDNTPISEAVRLGATTVYVLPTGYTCAPSRAPRSALGLVMQALTLLIEQRLIADVERYESVVDLRVLPPLCPLAVSPIDFSRARELMERSHDQAQEWLGGVHPQRAQAGLLGFHGSHRRGRSRRAS